MGGRSYEPGPDENVPSTSGREGGGRGWCGREGGGLGPVQVEMARGQETRVQREIHGSIKSSPGVRLKLLRQRGAGGYVPEPNEIGPSSQESSPGGSQWSLVPRCLSCVLCLSVHWPCFPPSVPPSLLHIRLLLV